MILTDYELNGRKTTQRVRESYAHLIPFFGNEPAERFGLRSREYIERRRAEGAAPATIRLELMNLGRGLTLAVQSGLLEYRPVVALPRVSNIRKLAIPEKRLSALLAELPSEVRDVAEFAYLTGWRVSEITGLLWSNVDRESCVIRLEPGTTKSGEGRVFPYDRYTPLATLMRTRWRKTVETELALGYNVPYVFSRRGTRIKRFTRSWLTACRRSGLEGFHFHDLRRSAAQNMVRAGVPIRTAMALMGHKTRSMFDRYHLVTEEDLRQGTERLAERWASRSRPGL